MDGHLKGWHKFEMKGEGDYVFEGWEKEKFFVGVKSCKWCGTNVLFFFEGFLPHFCPILSLDLKEYGKNTCAYIDEVDCLARVPSFIFMKY